MEQRPSLPAAVGDGLRRQLEHSATLQGLLRSAPAVTARRTTARTARRLAPLTADRLIAELKGTEPLLSGLPLTRPRRTGAALRAGAALTVAAVGGLVLGATPASAADRRPATAPLKTDALKTDTVKADAPAPGSASGLTTAASAAAADGVAMPALYPHAQSQSGYGQSFTVPATVTLVLAARADPAAVASGAAAAAGRRGTPAAPVRRQQCHPGARHPHRLCRRHRRGRGRRGRPGAARAGHGRGGESALTPAGLPAGAMC
ncbi:hypothetical protein GXW82_25880 [Streptacidiphilus sp. 4-A2]|nr:hypothetical protein [Streptacidiphilus sp. 4-A2]